MTVEPDLSPEVAARTHGLRTGWTTGTCASAAAKAAVIGLCAGEPPEIVEVGLPDGRRVTFPVEALDSHTCVVVKDAGDDPDCTHGARMTALAEWSSTGSTDLAAGTGIGIVTKPGLGIPIGDPSITTVPRRMIHAAIAEVTVRPVLVTLSVPGGEEMAAHTSNQRLGIIGGISILGTTGIVRPFSTAAYRASVVQQIDVAAAQGERMIVLATGSRSDAAAQHLWPELDPVCFVEVGDFTGIALRRAAHRGLVRVRWVGMAGKITKLAAGIMMTHFHRSAVDVAILEAAARSAGAPSAIIDAASATSTARHFFEACILHDTTAPLTLLCSEARRACQSHVDNSLEVEIYMVDFDGTAVVARG